MDGDPGSMRSRLNPASCHRPPVRPLASLYWRCHRRLISDALVAEGVRVEHIIGPDPLRPHRMTPGAMVTPGKTVVYPGFGEIEHTEPS